MKDIVKEYGGGLFELAVDEGIEETLLAETRMLSPLLTGQYLHLLTTPEIPKAERVGLVSESLEGRVHPYVADFVKIMVEHGAAHDIPSCFAEFERLYLARHGIIKAKVESAVPLTDRQKESLTARLAAHTGKKIDLDCTVVPDLIGGIRLSFDNRLIDDTAKNKLKEIAGALSGVVV